MNNRARKDTFLRVTGLLTVLGNFKGATSLEDYPCWMQKQGDSTRINLYSLLQTVAREKNRS